MSCEPLSSSAEPWGGADSSASLSKGMQGLSVRIAKALNRLMRRRGRVFADHYHSRLLRSPTQLVIAIGYVLGNAAHHFGGSPERDPFSSAVYDSSRRERVLSRPRGWLLLYGWRRAPRTPPWLTPILLRAA